MEHVKEFKTKIGFDFGWKNSFQPENRDVCKGKWALKNELTLNQVIEEASKMNPKPNCIIRAGQNTQWYLKHLDLTKYNNGKICEKYNKNGMAYIIEWF